MASEDSKGKSRGMIVLFVCVHNSGRSQMAEAFFNKLAEGKAKGISAGTQPADAVNPVVVKAMREAGIDISGNKPRALTMDMVEKADKMITMGCGAEAGAVCPASFIETEDWALEDPKGKSLEQVRKIRNEVKRRVTKLVEEVSEMSKVKVTKQDAEKLLANVPEEQVFWCCDGRIFRNMRDLADGLENMSDETFAYHLNCDKSDFSNWLRDVIGDEKLARDLENPLTRQEAAERVNDRVTFLNMKLS